MTSALFIGARTKRNCARGNGRYEAHQRKCANIGGETQKRAPEDHLTALRRKIGPLGPGCDPNRLVLESRAASQHVSMGMVFAVFLGIMKITDIPYTGSFTVMKITVMVGAST